MTLSVVIRVLKYDKFQFLCPIVTFNDINILNFNIWTPTSPINDKAIIHGLMLKIRTMKKIDTRSGKLNQNISNASDRF